MNKKHQKGFINHLRAVQWLTKRGYYVFNNISTLGPCDLICMNNNGNIMFIDVKTESKRKDGSIINRIPSDEQKIKNIRILIVNSHGKLYFSDGKAII